MRVFAKGLAWQPYLFQQGQGHARALVFVLSDGMDAHGLHQNLRDGKARVQAGIRVLKNDLHPAAVRAHLVRVQVGQVLALKHDAAGGGIGQPGQHHANGGLARAGLTHHTQGAPLVQREVGFLDGLEHAVPKQPLLELVVLAQTTDSDQRFPRGGRADALLGNDGAVVHKIVNDRQPARPVVQIRAAGNQGLGVGVFGRVEDGVDITRLAHHAMAHHNDLVGDFTDQAQIVADKQHAHFLALLQPGDQIGDLALHRHVQSRGGFISNQQLGFAGNRNGNHHPLLLAA